MTRKGALWLAAIPLLAVAAIGHWSFWYQPRIRAATPGQDLPSRILASERYESAMWIAHPHQNLPSLSETTGLDAAGLEAALRLAGVDAPRLRGVRIPPASAMAVAFVAADAVGSGGGAGGAGGERWIAAARVHPLAAGFLRLAGALAGNPWLGGGSVRLSSDHGPLDVTVGWQGFTWTASTDPSDIESLDDTPSASVGSWAPAVAWLRHRPRSETASEAVDDGLALPAGSVYLVADAGQVKLASRSSSVGTDEDSHRLRLGRGVLRAADALLLLQQRARRDVPDQSMLLLPLPGGTDASELPRSAVLHRSLADGADGGRWDLPGESLLDAAGHELPRGAAAGWSVHATDAVALGSGLAAAPELRTLAEDGLPEWGVWLDVVPASVEIDRLAAGLEKSPFLRRELKERWQNAAILLRALSRRPARIEGYVDGDEVLLRWSASPTSP